MHFYSSHALIMTGFIVFTPISFTMSIFMIFVHNLLTTTSTKEAYLQEIKKVPEDLTTNILLSTPPYVLPESRLLLLNETLLLS